MNRLENYPFVKEFIVDSSGQVDKVIINLSDYQKLVELLEDEGIYRAILEVKDEIPMSLSEALQELQKE
jgi:RelB Antitoxin alpha helical domain